MPISRPIRSAALNIVVDVEQMPPPMAPPFTLRPLMITPPYMKPRSTVTGPMLPQKLNHSPGARLRPSMSRAGMLMLFPKPLPSPGT